MSYPNYRSLIDVELLTINKYYINIHNVSEEKISPIAPWQTGQIKTCSNLVRMFKNNTSNVVMRVKCLEHCETHSNSYDLYKWVQNLRRCPLLGNELVHLHRSWNR